MVRGRWLPADELARRLDEVAASYTAPKERFKGMPDLPGGEVVRFEILWNDLVVGEERYVVLADGTVHAQQVNDPPWSERKTSIAKPSEERVLRTDGTLAPWAGAWPVLRALAPGERIEFPRAREGEGVRGFARIARAPDEAEARAFDCALHEPDGERRFTVLFDAKGLPCGFREEMQQGVVVYRRIG
jgi:hypothetical protein